jgi:hypothetical protein
VKTIPQGVCYIWVQTLKQGNFLVNTKIEPDFSICISINPLGCIQCIYKSMVTSVVNCQQSCLDTYGALYSFYTTLWCDVIVLKKRRVVVIAESWPRLKDGTSNIFITNYIENENSESFKTRTEKKINPKVQFTVLSSTMILQTYNQKISIQNYCMIKKTMKYTFTEPWVITKMSKVNVKL